MGFEFQPPPDWLLQEYMNRKRPGQTVIDSANRAAMTYLGYKHLRATQQNAALKNVLAAIQADPKLLETPMGKKIIQQSGVDLSGYQPVSPQEVSSQMSDVTPAEEVAQASMPSEHPMPSPIISHWDQTMGQSGDQSPTPSSGTVPSAGFQMPSESLLGRGKIGKSVYDEAMNRAEKQAKYAKKSGVTPEGILAGGFDPTTQVQVHPSSDKASESAKNKTFIGNDADGNPLFADKTGTISRGSVPGGGPVVPKSSTMPTASTRSSAEFANSIMPHIQDMRTLIGQADKAGYIGPGSGRVYGQFLAGKVGSTGDKKADVLLGELRATDSLLKSGALRVHFGSRGGQQMYEHFSEMLNSGKQSAAMLNGSLNGIEKFMKGYSNAGRLSGQRIQEQARPSPDQGGWSYVGAHQ